MRNKKLLLAMLILFVLCLAYDTAAADECSHMQDHLEYNETTHWWVCELCGEIAYGPEEHHADCDQRGICATCGAPYTGNDLAHWNIIIEYDENGHWKVCKNCGEITWGPSEHWAYCDQPGICGFCGAAYTGGNLEHREDILKHDKDMHWFACKNCGEITWGPSEHWAYCDQPGVCGLCGEPYTGNDLRHHDIILHDADTHWYVCEVCGDVSAPETHGAFCYEPSVCVTCGASYSGNNIFHGESLIEHDENTHWEICPWCGEISNVEEHSASYISPNVCGVCGAPMPGSGGTTTDPTPGTSEQAPAATWDASLGKLVTPDNPTYTGFADFEGGQFYIKDGQQATDFVGPVQVNGTFYAFDQGRLQTENMMMAFEGGLFAFNGGTLRTDLIGLAAYDGEQFVFDHGQYQHDACGPYLDPISGKWVYVNYGQFYPITDLVSYDGEVFYFVDGFLATGYTGIVYDFNNTGFYIASGQHYKITDLVSCNGEVLYVVDGKFASWYTGAVEDFQGTELNVVNGKVVQ